MTSLSGELYSRYFYGEISADGDLFVFAAEAGVEVLDL